MNRLAGPVVLLSALLVSVAPPTAAGRAQEEPPVVRALLDAAAVNSAVRPTYGGLELAPDGSITLSDFKTSFEADSDPSTAMSYTVERLVLADVTEIGVGVFEVGSAEWSNATVTAGGEAVAAIPLITAKSLYIHQPSKDPTALERLRASNVLAREFAMPEALIVIGGQSISVEDLSGTWDGDPMTGAGTSQFALRRIHVPGGVFEGEDNPLAMAGYSELELALQGTSVTVHGDGAVGFDIALSFKGRDVGSLIVEFAADGIPLDLLDGIDAGDPDEEALLGFADGISLKRARIRFEDDSLTLRLLSVLAEEEGTDVASFVAEGTEGMEMMLSESLAPDLARQISQAITAYLDDPKSITVALSPAQPVQFGQIMAGLEDPKTLIGLLQFSITAND